VEQGDEFADSVLAQPPEPATGDLAVSLPEFVELQIGLRQQERRTGGGASASDESGFQQGNRHIRFGERVGHQRPRHPSSDDRDIDFMMPGERAIPLLKR
jgi:hypothetical protein